MRRIANSARAELDRTEIWLQIARDNFEAADRWADGIAEAAERIAIYPGAGTRRDELAVGLRSYPVGNYVIFYTSSGDEIMIARVLHGARNLNEIFNPESQS